MAVKPETSLALMSRASQLLAEATTVQKAKELKDLALTAADWAKRKGLGDEAIQHARRYAVLAERQMGELLNATPRAKGTDRGGRKSKLDGSRELPSNAEPTLAELGITKRESSEAQMLASLPDAEFSEIESGKKTVARAKKEHKKKKAAKELSTAQAKVSKAAKNRLADVCEVRNCSMAELLKSGIKPDCIITDPPYPKGFLPVYGELARLSKDVPLIAVMCGQSYLPEILAAMSKHLKYRWTLAYLTPGGQAVQQWQSKVNTFWKPVLLFGNSTEWIGDVCRSDTNDNDKRFHGWGQSESGMADLVERLSKPGQLVCDPFVGGGTTALVSLRLGRKFIGCDIDAACVKQTIQRCEVDEHERFTI